MFILIEGYSKQADPLGWTARKCEMCRRVLPFLVFDLTTAHTFYFVPVWARTQSLMICDFCGHTVPFGEDTKISQRWDKRQSLMALVQATNPTLGEVDESSPPTDTQLIALLDRAVQIASTDNVNMKILEGGFVGLVLGAIAGVGLGLLLYNAGYLNKEKEGDVTLCIVCAWLLGCFGGVVGMVLDVRAKFRRKLTHILKAEIEHKNLDLARLQAVAMEKNHKSQTVLSKFSR